MKHQLAIACALESISQDAPVIFRGPIETLCRDVQMSGADGMELHLADPRRHDWQQIERQLQRADLELCAMLTGREMVENGLSLISNDADMRAKAVQRVKEHIDIAAGMDAMLVVGTMRGHVTADIPFETASERHRQAVLELAEYAARKNVIILIENITRSTSNYLNTMAEVADFVHSLACPNVRIHLDTYSMLQEENSIQDAVAVSADALDYVHFSDANRFYPGAGNVDFKSFLEQFIHFGYRGWIGLECVPLPDAASCAALSVEYIRLLERQIEIERLNPRVLQDPAQVTD